MKKVFKVIFIYLGVALLALLATIIFCAAFLFFYREGNIFGIKYISTSEYIQARDDEDMSGLKSIEITGDSFDIYIKSYDGIGSVVGVMYNKVFGFAKSSEAQAEFSLEYDEVNKVAQFSSVQPSGWLNKSKSYIEIGVPKTLAETGIDLVVISKKADILIGGETDFVINNIIVESIKGDVELTNTCINNQIDINIGSGLLYVDDKCSTAGKIDLNISLGSGKINFTKVNRDNFNIKSVKINSIKSGQIGVLKADELISDGNINGGGRIEIGEVGVVDFLSLDTDLSIVNLLKTEGNSSRIVITGHGDVWIDTVMCDLMVNGNNGSVYIRSALGVVDVETNKGNINIDMADNLVQVNTVDGDAVIKFNPDALEHNPDLDSVSNNYRKVIATTQNGHIKVYEVQNATVQATNAGKVTLEYDRVVGQNVILTQSGSVYIVVPKAQKLDDSHAFNLQLSSQVNSDIKVGIVGSLGDVQYEVNFNGKSETFNDIYNSGTGTENDLIINSTYGLIKVRSEDLINY
ncbi:MAG: hypothetical protein ACLRFE_00535 [Clostridia bacterium]